LCERLEAQLAAANRAAAPHPAPATATPLLAQLRIIWMALTAVTFGTSVAPVAVPALPGWFWMFPASMTLSAFLWWLYWLGESTRPVRVRMA
jgi:hypothetical protein